MNQIIEWLGADHQSSASRLERILWIDATASQVVTIELAERRTLPRLSQHDEIISAIETGVARVSEVDPSSGRLRTEHDIPEPHRRRRDEAWELIAPLVADGNPEIMLSRKHRGRLIAEIATRSGRSRSEIYGFLQRYWKGGGSKNALLPNYDHCGGRGKRRLATSPGGGPKRGSPKKYSNATNEGEGINITAEIEQRFKRGVKQFYETTERISLSQAFQRILEAFFHRGFAIINGAPTPILPPANELPTERQFRYWYEHAYRDVRREKIARHGQREYLLRHREVLGDSTQMAFGPGSLYQIDAAPADIYLVSSLDRTRIIGRPVIYVCVDVFSRMITGLCVTLEGPSWVSAMLALDNVVSDKVAFCAEYGITIREEDWPCHHLPEGLLADRGEFEGYQADHLVNALDIRVSNTPPYRADLKGIIERHFRIANERVIHFTPGAVIYPHTRGGADYRLDASLTLDEFRRLLICHALDHNQNQYMAWYRKDEWQVADGVECYPLELWNWGLRNRAGHLRTLPRDIVRSHLLPRRKVMVTYRGLHLGRGIYYTCDLAQREGWFARARERGAWKAEVAFDPRAIGTVYHYAGKRRLQDELLSDMSLVAANHCLGVLVIDEIQRLSQARSGGAERMLNFFVQLVNTIGVPVVLIGTYKALSLLSGEFSQMRRGTGQGDLIWNRLDQDEQWQLFIESLWRFQYTRKQRLLKDDPALSDVLYDESQGITDFAVKLYLFAQERAIESGKEEVTAAVIRSAAKDKLRLPKPVLDALRRGDYRVLELYEDVYPPLLERRSLPKANEGDRSSPRAAPEKQPAKTMPESSPEPEVSPGAAGIPSRKQTRRQKGHAQPAVGTRGEISRLAALAAKQNSSVYDLLRQRGHLRPVGEYLPASESPEKSSLKKG